MVGGIEKVLNIKVNGLDKLQKFIDSPFKKDIQLDTDSATGKPVSSQMSPSTDRKLLERMTKSLEELLKVQKAALGIDDRAATGNADELGGPLGSKFLRARAKKGGAANVATPETGGEQPKEEGGSMIGTIATGVAMGTGVGAIALIAGKMILDGAKKAINFSNENLDKRATFQAAAMKEGLGMSGAFIAETLNKAFMRNINIAQQLAQTQSTRESIDRYKTAALLGMNPEDFSKGDNLGLYVQQVNALKRMTAGQDAAFIAQPYKELLGSLGFSSFNELQRTDPNDFASRFYKLNKEYGNTIEARGMRDSNRAAAQSAVEREVAGFAKDQALSPAANVLGKGFNDAMTSLSNGITYLAGKMGEMTDALGGAVDTMKGVWTSSVDTLSKVTGSVMGTVRSFIGMDSSNKQNNTNSEVN